jgi:hypothetical protein
VYQPTISRAILAVTPLLGRCSTNTFRVLTSLAGGRSTSSISPCFRAGPGVASVVVLRQTYRKTTGMNVQVACTLTENLA